MTSNVIAGLDGGTWSRYLNAPAGGLALTVDNTGTVVLNLANLHGDIVATAAPSDNGPATYSETTEYGLPRDAAAPARRYGWLGSHHRNTGDALAQLTLMGVRLHNPTTGRFLSTVPAGWLEEDQILWTADLSPLPLATWGLMSQAESSLASAVAEVAEPWLRDGRAILLRTARAASNEMVVELRPGSPVRALTLAVRIDKAGAVVSLSDPERQFGSLELGRDEQQDLQSLVLAVLTGRAVVEMSTFLGFRWTRLVRWDARSGHSRCRSGPLSCRPGPACWSTSRTPEG